MNKLPKEYLDVCDWYINNQYDLEIDEGRSYYPGRYQNIAEVLKTLNPIPHKILDVGCLDGYGIQILQENGFDAWGIDIYGRALEKKLSDRVIKASADNIPFDNKYFDAVVSSGVLEHIHRTGLPIVLREMERVGRKNLHWIHLAGEPGAWSGGWHITVETEEFWEHLLQELGLEWAIYHQP